MSGHPSLSRKTRALTGFVLSVVATMGMLLSSSAVRADPSISELEKQIDATWEKLEPLLEQHNDTKVKLKAERKKLEALRKQLDPLEAELQLATAKVGEFASYLYRGGSTSELNSLLNSKSPTDISEQLIMLDQFSRMQQDSLSDVLAKRDALALKRKPIDDKIAALAEAEKDLAEQAKKYNVQVAALQKQVEKLYATTGSLGSLRPAPCPSTYPGGAAGIAAKFACAQIGKPYVWGADGPDSYDCSGLTMAAWRKAGVSLPHSARSQYSSTTRVSRANLRIGDLVWYYSDLHHVAMYVGNGWVVHASRAGVPIKMKRIDDGPIVGYGRPS